MLLNRNYLAFVFAASVSMPAFCSNDEGSKANLPGQPETKKHKARDDAQVAAVVQAPTTSPADDLTTQFKKSEGIKKRNREDEPEPASSEREGEVLKKALPEPTGNFDLMMATLKDLKNNDLYEELLDDLADIDDAHLSEIADVMVPFFNRIEHDSEFYINVFSHLRDIPAINVKPIFECASSIFTDMDIDPPEILCSILDTLQHSTDHVQLRHVSEMVVCLLTAETTEENILDLIDGLLLIPQERTADIHKTIKELKSRNIWSISGNQYQQIINLLLQYPDSFGGKTKSYLPIFKNSSIEFPVRILSEAPTRAHEIFEVLKRLDQKSSGLIEVLENTSKDCLLQKIESILSMSEKALSVVIDESIRLIRKHTFKLSSKYNIKFCDVFNMLIKCEDHLLPNLVECLSGLEDRDFNFLVNAQARLSKTKFGFLQKALIVLIKNDEMEGKISLDKLIDRMKYKEDDEIKKTIDLLKPFEYVLSKNNANLKDNCELLESLLSMNQTKLEKCMVVAAACDQTKILSAGSFKTLMGHLNNFSYSNFDQVAAILTKICSTDAQAVINCTSNMTSFTFQTLILKTEAFYRNKGLADSELAALFKAIRYLPDQNSDLILAEVENFFTDLKEIEPQLDKGFCPYYVDVIETMVNKVRPDKYAAIRKAATRIILDRFKRRAPDEDNLVVDMPPVQVIERLAKIPLDRIEAVVNESIKLVAGTEWSEVQCVDLALSLSKVAPEQLDEFVQIAERINRTNKNWSFKSQAYAVYAMILLPKERWNELKEYTDIITDNGGLDDNQNKSILLDIPFIPADQSHLFFQDRYSLFTGALGVYNYDAKLQSGLIEHATAMIAAGEVQRNHLFNHWKSLMIHEHKARAKLICDFITTKTVELGLHEEHKLVQYAIRIRTIIDDNSSKSPYVIYQKLKLKKTQVINWDELDPIMGDLNGFRFKLNHQALALLGASIQLDPSSVPKFTSADFIRLLGGLKEHLLANQDSLQQAAHMISAHYKRETGVTNDAFIEDLKNKFLLILDGHMQASSHMHRLVNGSAAHIESSKLKCVLNHFALMQNVEQKIQRLCQFLAGVRNCEMGQDTAIQDYYVALPTEHRLQSKAGAFQAGTIELPALLTLTRAIQSAVSVQFSPENIFMKKVCGLAAHEYMDQASHQINYIKGLIGNQVGLTEGPRFDVNAQCIYQRLLTLSMLDMLKTYYQHVKLDRFVPLVKTAFDGFIRAESNEGRKQIYSALSQIHKNMGIAEPFEDWVELDDDMIVFTEITTHGVIRTMQRAGVLDEIDSELPL